VYDEAVALEMSAQLPPVESQRFHWYAYAVGLPDHEPGVPFSAFPTCGVPEIDGSAVFEGGDTGAGGDVTTAVAADVAVAVATPLADPVTATRSVEPASPAATAYVVPVAPETGAQLEPLESQRDHW
jgi:hypothetical protein